MKIITFISMLLFCTICNGQISLHSGNIDTFKIDKNGDVWIHTDTSDYIRLMPQPGYVHERKRDTVMVLIEFSNISLQEYEYKYMDTSTTYKDYDRSVRWMFGYSVRERFNPNEIQMLDSSILINNYEWVENNYRHLCYLGEQKKPIPPNYIIWQSREVKQNK